MELLLFLSALLSAVTGAFSGVREAEPRTHHAAALEMAAPEAPRAALPAAVVTLIRVAATAAIAAEAPGGLAPFALAPAAALDKVRLLE